jgi:hypothetical protein
VLGFAKEAVPQIGYEFFEKASLGEREKILPAGSYKDVELFLFDMTCSNPSGTFKDMLACTTFA